jgi:hypothetical protein
MARQSTPKHEVFHRYDLTVVLTGISKTEATQIARAMNRDDKKKRIGVRRVAK